MMMHTGRSGFTQKLTIADSSTPQTCATAFQEATKMVLVTTTVNVYVDIAKTPSATTTNSPIVTIYEPRMFRVNPGEKLSAVQVAGSSSGVLTIEEFVS